MDLKKVKEYLRIDDDSEDVLLEEFIEFSKEEIKNSTGVDFNPSGNSKTYELAQYLIIADRYENRGANDYQIQTSNILTNLLQKLKYSNTVEEDKR